MNILVDATLPHVVELFGSPFRISLYKTPEEAHNLLPGHDILLCRSTLNVTAEFLAGSSIQCVATASSGVDHIDIDYLKNQGIRLLDAKGCNARAVADYVVATLARLYTNNLVLGNKAGVIGVGVVGSQVVRRLQAAGFEVICFDPLRETLDTDYDYRPLADLQTCDLLCVHANLHNEPPYPSVNLLSTDFLSRLKPGTIIINAARGGIINEDALLTIKSPITYCTDVYLNEPAVNGKIIDFATLCTPHIAGHSIEAKSDAVVKISQQLHQHFGLTPITGLGNYSPVILPTVPNMLYWQDTILSIYDPFIDTQLLKSATDKARAFVIQRQAHKNRHDFILYEINRVERITQLLLGHA